MAPEIVVPQFVPHWDQKENHEVLKVLSSDYLNEHKTVREFEKEFATFVGAKHCVTVTSGTIALYCAMAATACSKQKVLIPAHDGIFAFNALLSSDGIPVITDVDKNGILIPDETNKTVVVHANGRIAKHVASIEDCSQATHHHTKGKISTYSFASTKHITTAGQGGAICCDNDDIFETLARIKDHGRNDRQMLRPMSDNYEFWGMNFKFTEIQAGFGLAQLRKMPERMKRFDEILAIYKDILKEPIQFSSVDPKWYVDVSVSHPDKIIEKLKTKKIFCRRFPKPLNQQRIAKPYSASKYVGAESRYNCGLYLPSSTNLEDEVVKTVAEEINHAIAKL